MACYSGHLRVCVVARRASTFDDRRKGHWGFSGNKIRGWCRQFVGEDYGFPSVGQIVLRSESIRMKRIVILTGAGVSAESGVPTFRDAGGLWEGHRVEDVATPSAFRRNPELVHRFYNLRRAAMQNCEPNRAHQAIARLQKAWADHVTLITQNVDDLHERGGSTNVWHMHGELLQIRCERCSVNSRWTNDLNATDTCWECGHSGSLRPDIVWFGEVPYFLSEIDDALNKADIFIAIGTSGVVYPAAGMVDTARERDIPTIEFNIQRTEASIRFTTSRFGPASQTIPAWIDALLCE